MNKTTIARRIIASKSYFSNRMSQMDSECAFYLDKSLNASNQTLRDAFVKTAEMYFKRYHYYFKKISNNESRKSIQN